METNSKWINIAGANGSFGAYLSLPRGGSGPGIVLLQEIFGVNQHIRNVADQYAADGYVVLVPDIFWRQGERIELGYEGPDWQRAVELMNATDFALAQADVAATAKVLRAMAGVGRIASLGFCFGGKLSYHTAANGVVDAAVCYYGGGIQHGLARASEIRLPVLMHFGALDSHIPLSAVQSIAEQFDDNEQVEIHVYPDAEHGFNCNHRSSYHQRSAALARGHTLQFLAEQL
ncbi:dienelactone hydrolase family protein [Pseudoduganella sp. FT93W]|uniref:Dienelactone hydrolase family protein n=1 Tax=Duganella fentianensis TaxID=2692177 RepID=A0A845I604_9BURK|nr:dienelactone hydrolase family protein [Duganella fentianensis]MYN46678.1 dienelactone hydrolase family protein [Duganella fentianensis]